VFGRAIGKLDHLRLHAHAVSQSRIKGLTRARVSKSAEQSPSQQSTRRRSQAAVLLDGMMADLVGEDLVGVKMESFVVL